MAKKEFTKRTLRVFSRHPSHNVIRKAVLLPDLAVFRLGSTTPNNGIYKVEINTVDAIKNSANKLRMKKCFDQGKVKTAEWFQANIEKELIDNARGVTQEWSKPLVMKHVYGSRGKGNTLINSEEELVKWCKGKTLASYIGEAFYNYTREYRLHVTEDGCFYTCRKMLKSDTPEDKKRFRNDSNCSWFLDSNPQFDKPSNWKDVEQECVKALKAVGLHIGACDVRIQSSKKKTPDFVVLEINSAASFGDETANRYKEILPKVYQSIVNKAKK